MTTTLPPAPYTGIIRCTFVQCHHFYTVPYRKRADWEQVLADNCERPWRCKTHEEKTS